ncbi:MAG TPA: hypothetical protein VF156_05260 [Agromyces sp.]
MAAGGGAFDPRYDARYQRGWVEGSTDAAAPAGPAPTPQPTAGRPTDAAHDGADEASVAVEAAAEAEAPQSARSEPDPPAPTADRGDPPLASSGALVSGDVRPAVPDDRSERITRAGIAGALAVSLLSALVGAGLISWYVTDGTGYGPGRSAGEMILDSLAYGVAPDLLAAGLVAVVVVTVVDAVRRRADGAGSQALPPGTAPLVRAVLDRAVLVLGAAAVVSAAVIWRLVSWRVEAEQLWAEIGDNPPTPEQERMLRLFDLLPYLLSPAATMVLVAALVGIPLVVGARYAAIVRRGDAG